LAGLVLLRALLCFSAPAPLHHSEEFVNLRLAAALLGDESEWAALGADSPTVAPTEPRPGLFDFQYQDWDGGTLVVSLVLVPIAALSGLSLTTVKTGATLWSLGVAVAWLLLLGRLWGDSGKRWAALAFAAVPVPYLLASSIHWGNHAESALFLPLVLLLLCVASGRIQRGAFAGYVAGAGLLAGFGVYFSLLNLLPVGLCLLTMPLFFGRRSLLALPIFAVSGLIGALPYLGRNSPANLGSIGAQGVSITDLVTGGGGALPPPKRWVHGEWPVFGRWDLHGLWAPEGALANLLEHGTRYAILTGAAVALTCTLLAIRGGVQQRRRLAVVAVLAATYALLPVLLDRSWQLADRRLAPLYPIGWILMICGGLSLPRRYRLRQAGLAAISAVLTLNLVAGLTLISSAPPPEVPLHPWTHFALPKAAPHLRIESGIGDLANEEVAEFTRSYRRLLAISTSAGQDELRGLRRALAPSTGAIGVLHRPAPACPSPAIIERAPPSEISTIGEARGFGAGLALRCKVYHQQSPQGDPARAETICELLPDTELRAACFGPLVRGRL